MSDGGAPKETPPRKRARPGHSSRRLSEFHILRERERRGKDGAREEHAKTPWIPVFLRPKSISDCCVERFVPSDVLLASVFM